MNQVIIIGGGPAGLSAGIYLARANLSPLIFSGSPPGGQLMLTSEVENFPGHDSILGAQLIEKMREQAVKFGAKIIDQNITKVNLYVSKKEVESEGKVYTAKAVIIAVGASALWLNVPGEQRLRGKGVSACATCDGFFFRDKIVAVIGGGDTAMEEALTLTKFAKKVYIIHRRDSFRASKIMQERVFTNPKIEIIWNAVVEEVLGEEKLEAVRLKSVKVNQGQLNSEKIDSNRSRPILTSPLLKINGLFVAIGHKPDTDIFIGQAEMDEKGYIITTERLAIEYIKFKIQNSLPKADLPLAKNLKMTIQNEKLNKLLDKFNLNYKTSTSVEGVFAAGDCVDFEYRQAATASGMGVIAALEVERYLDQIKY